MSIRVLVVEPHRAFLSGIQHSLPQEFEIAAEAHTANEALHLTAEAKPDIVLTPFRLPDENGVWLAERLIELYARTVRVVMLSGVMTEDVVVSAIRAGVLAFVSKNQPTDMIAEAMLSAWMKRTYLCPEATRVVCEFVRRNGATLSTRQVQILRGVVAGRSSKEIGATLHLNEEAVRSARKKLLKQLGVRNAVQLASAAARMGIVGDHRTPAE